MEHCSSTLVGLVQTCGKVMCDWHASSIALECKDESDCTRLALKWQALLQSVIGHGTWLQPSCILILKIFHIFESLRVGGKGCLPIFTLFNNVPWSAILI